MHPEVTTESDWYRQLLEPRVQSTYVSLQHPHFPKENYGGNQAPLFSCQHLLGAGRWTKIKG